MPTLTRAGDVFVLNLGDGENRLNPDFLGDVEDALDVVSGAATPRALVTTADGKFWSNGLDLDWMASQTDDLTGFLERVHDLFASFLGLGIPTVAAIGGHAFAAGAMLATAHDVRIMRVDRGYWCVPEVDLRMPFTPGMTALLTARLSKQTAHEAMTTGRRYTGPQALQAGIVDAVAALDEVVPVATARAQELANKDGDTLEAIKQRLYGQTLEQLRGRQR